MAQHGSSSSSPSRLPPLSLLHCPPQESLHFRRLRDPPGTPAMFTGLAHSGVMPAALPVPMHKAAAGDGGGSALPLPLPWTEASEEGAAYAGAEAEDMLDEALRAIDARPVVPGTSGGAVAGRRQRDGESSDSD